MTPIILDFLQVLGTMYLSLMIPAILVIALGCGIAHLSGIDRYDMPGYKLLVARGANAPAIVDAHCRKGPQAVRFWDDGSPVDGRPIRACTRPAKGKLPTVIVIPEQFLSCLPHEIAHATTNLSESQIQAKYPCVGEKKK